MPETASYMGAADCAVLKVHRKAESFMSLSPAEHLTWVQTCLQLAQAAASTNCSKLLLQAAAAWPP
jgi:hypothetical protein